MELALFNSLYAASDTMNAEEKNHVRTHIATKNINMLSPNNMVNKQSGGGGGRESSVDPSSVYLKSDVSIDGDSSVASKNSRMDMLRQLNQTQAADNPNGLTSIEENLEDITSLESWQKYTIECMKKEKTGPKKTLPVLMSTLTEPSNTRKQFTGGRARRWGGGALIELPAESEEHMISGPSSYLDVYKTNFKIRSSVKERNKIAEKFRTMRLENSLT
jgi:hypothetical protein